jgi:dTDP-4-amino-4,6-dideoxygalactose transaminase
VGYTSRLDEIQAAVLRVKLTKLAEWNDRRKKIADIYFSVLAGSDIRLPITLPGNNHTFHQFSILSSRRDELQAFLKAENVDSMIYYPVPLHFHEPYAHLAKRGSLPVTEEVSNQVLSLPIHPHLSEEQAQFAVEQVREFGKVGVGA